MGAEGTGDSWGCLRLGPRPTERKDPVMWGPTGLPGETCGAGRQRSKQAGCWHRDKGRTEERGKGQCDNCGHIITVTSVSGCPMRPQALSLQSPEPGGGEGSSGLSWVGQRLCLLPLGPGPACVRVQAGGDHQGQPGPSCCSQANPASLSTEIFLTPWSVCSSSSQRHFSPLLFARGSRVLPVVGSAPPPVLSPVCG